VSGWGEYLAAWGMFLLSHMMPMRPPVKPWLVRHLGATGYGLAYSALSVAALGWLLGAAARAPHVPIWSPPDWGPWVVFAAMVLASAILALGLGRPNPQSFGGWRNERFNADAPGLVGWVRHPVLAALLLWSAGHLAVRGDLAHGAMFAGFAGFALLGMWAIDRRKRRDLGQAAWNQRLRRMRAAPVRIGPDTVLRLGLAVGLVGLLVWLHPWLAGPFVAWHFLP